MTATEGESPVTGGEPARALGSAYVLYERVGRGASGEVWRGLDSRTGAPVAVKVLRSVLAQQRDIVEAFLRERAILMRLHDPHIVQLRDLVVESDTVALVTDFAGGGDLRSRLGGGPLPVVDALDIVGQVLDGLDAAHRRGVVHRDLKPENVLVEGAGDDMVVRITDFGIATLIGSSESSDPLSLIGSPEYMAPEVIEARRTTPAADLYSAGILLYELLTGHTPFAGGAPMAVLRRHVNDAPARVPDIPDDVWNVIAALLAKDPAARPPSARAAARRLRAVAAEISGRPPLDPVLDEVEVDEPGHDLSPSSAWEPSADEDTTVVRRRRGAAALRRRRRVWTASAIAVVVVAAGAAIGIRTLARHHNAVPHVRLTGVPTLQRTGEGLESVVTRTWDLSGRAGDRVAVTLHVRNVGSAPVNTVYEPPLPGHTSLLARRIAIPPGREATVVYSFRTGPLGLDVAELLEWEQTLNVNPAAAAVTLASATVYSRYLRLDTHERAHLNINAVTTTGEPAPSTLLSGILWSSSDRRVADVLRASDGRLVVVAGRQGSAVLSAELGEQRLVVHVSVTGGRRVSTGPCEPGVSQPQNLTSIADGTIVSDGRQSWIIAGGARLPYQSQSPVGALVRVLTVEQIAEIGPIPKDKTVLRTDDGATWIVMGGARVPLDVAAEGPAPLPVPAASVESIPRFGRGTGFTDGTLVRVTGGPVQVYRGSAWSPAPTVCAHASIVDIPAGVPVSPR